MTDFQINDYLLGKECDELAQEIFDEIMGDHGGENPEDYRDEMDERAHETADGHEWVIYHHKALLICAHCDTERGEDYAEGMGQVTCDISKLATTIAYGEMLERIREKLGALIYDYEPETPDDADETPADL